EGVIAGDLGEAESVLASASAVLVSDYGRGVAAVPDLRRAVTAAGRPTVWDPHPRGPEPVAGTTVVTPSHAEVFQLTRDVAHSDTADASRLATTTRRAATLVESWGVGAAAVTMGQAGAVLVRSHGAPMVVPTRSVAAFDPCGAGDSFAAALVTAM